VLAEGIRADPIKVEASQSWSSPKKNSEREFHGRASFIAGLSTTLFLRYHSSLIVSRREFPYWTPKARKVSNL